MQNEPLADPLDKATELSQIASDSKVKEIQELANQPLPTSETCLWCGNKTKEGRRWCNADCRDMHTDFGGM